MRDVNKADFAEAFKLLQRLVDYRERASVCPTCGSESFDHLPGCIVAAAAAFLDRFRT
jgi:hypothetical protein